jgi:hypothetical protein
MLSPHSDDNDEIISGVLRGRKKRVGSFSRSNVFPSPRRRSPVSSGPLFSPLSRCTSWVELEDGVSGVQGTKASDLY